MKILTPDQTKEVKLKPFSRNSPNEKVYDKLAEIEIGGGMLLPKKEWKVKSSPSTAIPSMCATTKRANYTSSKRAKSFLNKKFSVRQTEDEKHWLIIRKI